MWSWEPARPQASELRVGPQVPAGSPGHGLFWLAFPQRLVCPDQGVVSQGLEARPETASWGHRMDLCWSRDLGSHRGPPVLMHRAWGLRPGKSGLPAMEGREDGGAWNMATDL